MDVVAFDSATGIWKSAAADGATALFGAVGTVVVVVIPGRRVVGVGVETSVSGAMYSHAHTACALLWQHVTLVSGISFH